MQTNNRKQKKLIVLSGPTASGKTEMAIWIAQTFKTEIISADSRQFYREMQIGTAAPTAFELEQAVHHFVHHLSIHDSYDVATYEQQVIQKLDELFQIHDYVVLTGGSGLFIDAVCEGLDVIPPISTQTRKKLDEIYKSQGLPALQQLLQEHDPIYFAEVDQNNPRRLQRALEVYFETGKKFSSFRTKTITDRPFECIHIALDFDKDELVNRIHLRVDKMIESGLLEEAKALFSFRHLNALNTVGYKELFAYFEGKNSLEEAIERIKINTRQYAKRQRTWLRKGNKYTWFKPEDKDGILAFIRSEA